MPAKNLQGGSCAGGREPQPGRQLAAAALRRRHSSSKGPGAANVQKESLREVICVGCEGPGGSRKGTEKSRRARRLGAAAEYRSAKLERGVVTMGQGRQKV